MNNSSQIRQLPILLALLVLIAAISGCQKAGSIPSSPIPIPSPTNAALPGADIATAINDPIQTVFVCKVIEPMIKTTMGAPHATHGKDIPEAEVALFLSRVSIGRVLMGKPRTEEFYLGFVEGDTTYDINPGNEYLVLMTERAPGYAYMGYDSVYLIRNDRLERIGRAGAELDINGMMLAEALSVLGIQPSDTGKYN